MQLEIPHVLPRYIDPPLAQLARGVRERGLAPRDNQARIQAIAQLAVLARRRVRVPRPEELGGRMFRHQPVVVELGEPEEAVEEGGLPRAGPAADPNLLARLDRKADVPHGGTEIRAVSHHAVPELNHRSRVIDHPRSGKFRFAVRLPGLAYGVATISGGDSGGLISPPLLRLVGVFGQVLNLEVRPPLLNIYVRIW
jgi:hypothetical protein